MRRENKKRRTRRINQRKRGTVTRRRNERRKCRTRKRTVRKK